MTYIISDPIEQLLITNYKKVKKTLGHIPSHREMRDKSVSEFSTNKYAKVFGSWPYFLREVMDVSDRQRNNDNIKVSRMKMSEKRQRVPSI